MDGSCLHHAIVSHLLRQLRRHATKHRIRNTTSDVANCNLDCLDHDAFDFPGAANVTTVNIQHNNFLALPETLLWNMTSLQHFDAQNLVKLATLQEGFFKGMSQLKKLHLTGSVNLGVDPEQRLPDSLFKGLTSLVELKMNDCRFYRLPNLDNLTVCSVSWTGLLHQRLILSLLHCCTHQHSYSVTHPLKKA